MIMCKLFTISAERLYPYETVSYAWGKMGAKKTCTVNGIRARIRVNLYDALVRFRYPYKPRILWADALCINQADDKEKPHQVAQMAQIYQRCKCVLIYLVEAAYRPFLPNWWIPDSSCMAWPEVRNPDPFYAIPLLALGGHFTDLIHSVSMVNWSASNHEFRYKNWILTLSLRRMLASKWLVLT
jgi:hypothetical protein